MADEGKYDESAYYDEGKYDETQYDAAQPYDAAYDDQYYAQQQPYDESQQPYDESQQPYDESQQPYDASQAYAYDEQQPYAPQQAFPLGSAAPPGYVGYWDETRGEMYAFHEASGECAYGVGPDGDVYALDYRSVMWCPGSGEDATLALQASAAERTSSSQGSRRRSVAGSVKTLRLKDAAVVVQAAHRRSLGWAKAAARVRKQFCRRYDFESGFYYYERIKGGETQWHRPAVLLGTRRRRGLGATHDDVALVGDQPGGEVAEYAGGDWELGGGELGEYYARGGGETKDNSRDAPGKSSVDKDTPLFLDNTEIDPQEWSLGDEVQVFDGIVLKRVMVEPYMLARGAVAIGPTEVVRLMQRARRPQVLNKYPKIPALVGQCLGSLVSLADNYAHRSVILKEEWARLVVSAVNNLTTESQEVIVHHADGNEKVVVRTATRQSCDIAANGCRLFAVFACDPKLREEFAEDAIKVCNVAMDFCDEDATVQAAACDCLYNYVYRCEFAAVIAEDLECLDRARPLINFQGDQDFVSQADRAEKR
ncbi:hypothetical protein JL720_11950 [Aureococcus anophagefferens]|nr:hypothetical protein JL720_11950 [Aureococcus anophagefferens]